MMGPILEQVGAHLKNKIQVVKIDSDKYSTMASQYHISALPTLVLFKGGVPVDRIEGVVAAPQLIEQLQRWL
jgi:thioredoxin-like negative regulator of GroEL